MNKPNFSMSKSSSSLNGHYDDIINLPHHVSATRPRMPVETRAAQFAPFAALTGYDAAIGETARLTDERMELDEDVKADIAMKLGVLADMVTDHPEVAVTFFKPDGRKAGGAYVTVVGNVKKIDDYERVIVLASGERIAIEDIIDIGCELFQQL